MKEYVDFKIYFEGKQEAARKRDGMDRQESGGPSQEDARSQVPPRGTTGTTATAASDISAGRTPESATPVTDLLRDPGGTRRAIAPTLAQIPLAATPDVAATGVGRKRNEIALQIPHPPPDRPRLNNFLLLSRDSIMSRFLQYTIRPQVSPRPKSLPRSCPRFRPVPAREKTSIVNVTHPYHQGPDEVALDPFRHC